MIEPGERAPGFSAPDDEGNTVSLEALRGAPVVLHFFAVAWSGV